MYKDFPLSPAVLALSAIAVLAVILLTVTRLALREALHDSLTGLPNRELWSIAAVARYRMLRDPVVIMIDINDLKGVNDSLGHDYGDRLIHMFAQKLVRLLDPSAIVGRLGGDEFVALLDLAPHRRAMLGAVAQRLEVTVEGITAGASLGVAHLADLDAGSCDRVSGHVDDRSAISRLLRASDLALLRAKAICRSTEQLAALSYYDRGSDGDVPRDFGSLRVSGLLQVAAAVLLVRPSGTR